MKTNKRRLTATALSQKEFLSYVNNAKNRINPLILQLWGIPDLVDIPVDLWDKAYQRLKMDYKKIPVLKLTKKALGHGEGFDSVFHPDFINAIKELYANV